MLKWKGTGGVPDDAGSDIEWQRLLGEQVRRNARLFYQVAYRVLRNSAAAEDVCQQAFLAAWTERHSIREPGRLAAWLTRTIVNTSLQIMRRQRTERTVLTRLPPARSVPSVSQALEDTETVTLALAALPENLRTVVVLRIMQGLSGREVQQLLGTSAAGVSRALHEGLERLRRTLADHSVT